MKSKILILIVTIILFSVSFYLIYKYTEFFVFKTLNIFFVNDTQNRDEIKMSINEIVSIEGKKYFELNPDKIKSEILSNSHFTQEVNIEKIFPNSINIYIRTKQPLISLEYESRCILLDEYATPLKIEENDCKEQLTTFKTILVSSDSPKVDFVLGKQSNYAQLEYIKGIVKVLNNYNIAIVKISVKDNVAIFLDNKQRTYVFSFNQPYIDQLSRLIALFTQFQKKDYKYNQIDLRFVRPVLTTK